MYADIFGTLPIAEALVAKGVGLGTALSFMMGVTALSLPSMIMLKKVKMKLLVMLLMPLVIYSCKNKLCNFCCFILGVERSGCCGGLTKPGISPWFSY